MDRAESNEDSSRREADFDVCKYGAGTILSVMKACL